MSTRTTSTGVTLRLVRRTSSDAVADFIRDVRALEEAMRDDYLDFVGGW